MKTLDQIWDENFGLLTPAQIGGYSGSCGNGLGGSNADNQKGPLDTLADKINAVRNGPDGDPLSDAAKDAKIQQIKEDANKRGKMDGKGPIREGPDPYAPLIYPDGHTGANPPREPSYDPNDPANSKGGPPNNGIPDYGGSDIDMGGLRAGLAYDKDGNVTLYGEYIKPDPRALLKTGLTAGAVALRKACSSGKPNGNVDPNADPNANGNPQPKPPTPTQPLVPKPGSKPPSTEVPFRITPPRPQPPANIIGQRPVVPTTCWVAREVYGVDNPKWLQFREWMLTEAADILRNYYIEYGERIAEWIRNKPRIKAIIRKWMDSKIKSS